LNTYVLIMSGLAAPGMTFNQDTQVTMTQPRDMDRF